MSCERKAKLNCCLSRPLREQVPPPSLIAVVLVVLWQGGEVAPVRPEVRVEVQDVGRVWPSAGQERGSAWGAEGLLRGLFVIGILANCYLKISFHNLNHLSHCVTVIVTV